MSKKKNEILINGIFIGDYLNDKFNIGHEFINLYQSDNDKFYAYASPYGNINSNRDKNITYILNGRTISGEARIKIISYAEVKKQVLLKTVRSRKSVNNKKKSDEQLEYIKNNNITYGGVSLDNIFNQNVGHKDADKNPFYITFETGKVYIAKKDLYFPSKYKKFSSSMKIYVDDHTAEYAEIIDLINIDKNESDKDKHFWEEASKLELSPAVKSSMNIFQIIKKENDENIISNMFAYYLTINPRFKELFFKKVLGLDITNEKIEVIREKENNIDLFILLEDQIVIIENKIRANVIKRTGKDKKYSQLEKYINHGIKRAKELRIEEDKVFYFILRPDYNNEEIIKYDKKSIFNEIKYSSLLDIIDETIDLPYNKEFRYLVELHSSKFDNQYYEQQHLRLTEVINKKKINI